MQVNDIHSALNPTTVARVVPVGSVGEAVSALAAARAGGLPVCIAGGRHAMGGQQFCGGAVLLDMRTLSGVGAVDVEAATAEVAAGSHWPELIEELASAQAGRARLLTIAQKQTGADRLTIGGALAANVHGRGLAMRPIVSDVESFRLVDASGAVRNCSRDENGELFRLAIGGYGLFGCIVSVTLRLVPRRTLERVVEIRTVEELEPAFADRVAEGYLYGDFQFAIDPDSPDFLRIGVFSCYRPVEGREPQPGQRALSSDDWQRLIRLAHVDKARAWELYSQHYLATSGQLYQSDAPQLADYTDGYHSALDRALGATDAATEMISELYVPRAELAGYMHAAATDFRRHEVDVIYGTIRLIERDDETFLAWAREPWACVIFNIHTVHTPDGIEHAAAAFRRLIDLALERGGSYYLTYHRWATREQVLAAYPRFPDFLAAKLRHDPGELFQSDWYRHHRDLLA